MPRAPSQADRPNIDRPNIDRHNIDCYNIDRYNVGHHKVDRNIDRHNVNRNIDRYNVDRHNVDEVYPTLMVVLIGSFVLGVLRPRHAWRWAIIIGLGVPFFGPLPALPARLASPGRWAMLAVLLIPGLIGAYTGSILRSAAGAPQ